MAVLDGVRKAARVLAAALLVGVVALVSYSAVARYFFNSPIRFAEEVTGLLMIGMLFLAIGGAGRPAHLRVGILADALPRKARQVFSWLALLVLVLFCGVFGWEASRQVMFNYEHHIRSEIVGWWLFPWAALIPVALVLVVLDALIRQARGEEGKGEARDGT